MSQAIRRFFYVVGPHSTVAHMMFGKTHSEGLTACGRAVARGWLWSTQGRLGKPRCKQCERAA